MRPELAPMFRCLLTGLLLVLPVGHALAGEPGAIQLTPERAVLQLGRDSEVEVRIDTLPEATELQLFTSRGELGPVRQAGPGRYTATFRVPRARYPQVAILAAVARVPAGALHGWTVLPLWGQGTAEVHTRPGTPVSLLVGSRRFGPVVADTTGVAHVPVQVPPGVTHAEFAGRRIPLGVPPLPTVQAIPERPEVAGDAAQVVTVRLYAVTPDGKAGREQGFRLKATRGTVERPEPVAPGVSVVRWRLPAGSLGPVELEGSLAGEQRPLFSVKVEVVSGPARRFALHVDRETVTAAEDARVKVEVLALDDAGNPAEASLRLAVEGAEAGALRALGAGRYEASLSVPARFGTREAVDVSLQAEGSDAPLGSYRLLLRPAAPARVTVTASEPRLEADGVREARYRVVVEDRFGNPVREPPTVVFASEPVGALLPGGPGEWLLRYVPSAVDEVHESRVEVRAGDAIGSGSLRLEPVRAPTAVHLRAGVVTDFGRLRALAAGAQVELRPWRAPAYLRLSLAVDGLTFGGLGAGGPGGVEGRSTYLSLSPALTAHLWLGEKVDLWGAVGPALAWVRSASRVGPGPSLAESAWVWGAQGSLGVGRRWGPGMPFLEARVLGFSDPGLHVLRGELLGVGLLAGYRLELF
ncbi:hypothetical protein P2318_13270 [Myxococcaceae bacterium GXIMD 01537]